MQRPATPEYAGSQDFFSEHREPLLHLARRLCRTNDEAQDLVQDTFERALRCSDRFQAGTNARAWLSTILRRLFLDQYRRTKRAPQLAVPLADPEPIWAAVTREGLDNAVADLGDAFRMPFVLHTIEGHSYDAIALQLEIKKATVGTRINRARHKLRALLTERERLSA